MTRQATNKGATPKPPGKNRDDEDAPAPGFLAQVPLTEGQIKGLRVSVGIMSALLVVGLVALIGRIIYLVGRPSAAAPGQAAAVRPMQVLTPDIAVQLPAGAVVRGTSLNGDRLAVQYDGPSGAGVMVLDLATGQVLSRVTLKPGP